MIRFFNSILMMLSMLSYCRKASAQIDEQQMKTIISLQNSGFRQDISTFYTYLGYQAVWTRKSGEPLLSALVDVIKSCKNIGLNENDYDLKGIDSVRQHLIALTSTEDSLRAEIRITMAAIRYCSDLHYNNTEPAFGYKGVSNHVNYRNIIAELAAHVLGGDIASLADGAAALPEIRVLFHKLMWFNQVMSLANFRETTISSNQISTTNYPLMKKLYQLGLIDTIFTIPSPYTFTTLPIKKCLSKDGDILVMAACVCKSLLS